MAESNDFRVCDAITSAIEEYYGYEVIIKKGASVPKDRLAIHYIYSMTAFLHTNGFDYFWGVSADHDFYAIAFEEIGEDILARLIRDSLSLIVDKTVLGDYDKVTDYFGSREKQSIAAEPFEEALYSRSEQIQSELSKYIRIRRYEFTDIEKYIVEAFAKQDERENMPLW